MIGIVVTGHGTFASGLKGTIELGCGIQEQMEYVDFTDKDSTDSLSDRIKLAIQNVDTGQGVIVYTDLLGGSPFRCAALLKEEFDNLEVMTGTNFPMLAESLDYRTGDMKVLLESIKKAGRESITYLGDESEKIKVSKESNEGI